MILPRYSIRTLLILTFIAAVTSLVHRQALAGDAWAIGLFVSYVVLGCVIGSHAILFLIAQLFVALRNAGRRPEAGASPFASAGLPRQIVAPVDPE